MSTPAYFLNGFTSQKGQKFPWQGSLIGKNPERGTFQNEINGCVLKGEIGIEIFDSNHCEFLVKSGSYRARLKIKKISAWGNVSWWEGEKHVLRGDEEIPTSSSSCRLLLTEIPTPEGFWQ